MVCKSWILVFRIGEVYFQCRIPVQSPTSMEHETVFEVKASCDLCHGLKWIINGGGKVVLCRRKVYYKKSNPRETPLFQPCCLTCAKRSVISTRVEEWSAPVPMPRPSPLPHVKTRPSSRVLEVVRKLRLGPQRTFLGTILALSDKKGVIWNGISYQWQFQRFHWLRLRKWPCCWSEHHQSGYKTPIPIIINMTALDRFTPHMYLVGSSYDRICCSAYLEVVVPPHAIDILRICRC